MTIANHYDVIVVGGGIAGGAAAARLASTGFSVLSIEKESQYTDQVRGEGLVQWGVEAAAGMDLDNLLYTAPGATVMTRVVAYDELITIDQARAHAEDMTKIIPGIPGLIGIGHPEFRQALADKARDAGATLLYGVKDARVNAGETPSVEFTLNDESFKPTCRLVIVADGRGSTIRKELGIQLESTVPRVMLSGMLVEDGGAWDRAETTIGVVNGNHLYVFPRQGVLRLYVGRRADHPEPLRGEDKEQRFLESFRNEHIPHGEAIANGKVVGPCNSFLMTDSWTATPYSAGVVLAGDAAGWSNPITGQGLAIALRDAKVLTDLLIESEKWDEKVMQEYTKERTERMRRLRFASALTDLLTAHGVDDRANRQKRMRRKLRENPEFALALGAVHKGPWTVPLKAFEPNILTSLAMA